MKKPAAETEWLRCSRVHTWVDSKGASCICDDDFIEEYFILPKHTRRIRLLLYTSPIKDSYRIYIEKKISLRDNWYLWSWKLSCARGLLFNGADTILEKYIGYISPDKPTKFYLRIECR